MQFKQATAAIAIVLLAIASQFPSAAVTPEEAAKLNSELTPLGAEKAGNKDGTIPAWDGGYTKVEPGYQSGQLRPDPFASEKPLFQVTAKNMAQYADQLSDGIKALLQRYPTYRLDVYPTHRTAAAPQWVYDSTFKNATSARLVPNASNGPQVDGAYGGIPFPIPGDGAQAMWNHLLAWKGEAFTLNFGTYVVPANGRPMLGTVGISGTQYQYYYRDGALDRFGGKYWMSKLTTNGPPIQAGEKSLAIYSAGKSLQIWQYLVGQRRVRRLPNFEYDTPSLLTSGFSFVDEGYLFLGNLDRYDWKLVGKKEMFVPYNTQRFYTQKVDQVLGPRHLNPDHLRWELHRVWVVEATLAAGKRHVIPKRRFYLDEDTWQALLSDGWDAGGQLWHVGQAMPVLIPEQPAVIALSHVIYDLVKNGYAASSMLNEQQGQYQAVPRWPEDYFSPATLVAEGVR